MIVSDGDPPAVPGRLREYVGFVWIGDRPGRRLRLLATSSSDAVRRVEKEHGVGHVVSIWNEDDARRLR